MQQSQLYTIYDSDPGPVVAFIEYIRDLYHLPRPGVLLDMGCGPGRLLAPLSASAWSVTGYEPDPEYGMASDAVLGDLPDGRFVRGGFLDLDEDSVYDLIAAVNGPYYYVLEAADRRSALARCARALRPGGVLVLELSNFYWILKNYREPPTLTLEIDGVTVTRTAQHDFDYDRGLMTHEDRFTWSDASGTEQTATKTHRMAMVSYSEIALFLEDAGFTDVHTFNSMDDRTPAPLGGRKILVSARRGPL